MSWKLTGIASKKRVGSTSRKFLLVAMCDKANDDGTGVYASFATLANMIEGSRPTVKRLVKEFLAEGLIRHVGMRNCTNGKTNEYDVIVDALEALPDIGDEQPKKRMNPVRHEPGSQRPRVKVNRHPGQGEPPTRVMVTPKPILKPIPEPSSLVGSEEPTSKTPQKSPKPKARETYTPEFNAIWLSWPAHRRANSDKKTAFKRYLTGVGQFGHEAIEAAAKRYLAMPETRKQNFQYCCLVEVFMNGKLEAAVEAAANAGSSEPNELWDPQLKRWIEIPAQ